MSQRKRQPDSQQPVPMLQEGLHTLFALFNSGRYVELESHAARYIEHYPTEGQAWKVLAAAQYIQGKDALPTMRRAVSLLADDAEVHNNLGIILMERGQQEDAAESFHNALKASPEFPDAHNNLGSVLRTMGRLDDAVQSHHQALKFRPDFPEALNNLGIALMDLGRMEEAAESCRQALRIKPEFVEAHNNLGITLLSLGRLDEAVQCFRQAVELKPNFAEALNNYGSGLRDLGRFEDAVLSYRRALEIRPHYAEAHKNLGVVLRDLDLMEDAVACCIRALELRPAYAEAHNSLGNALNALGRQEDAIASYRRAIEIKPSYAEAHNNLGNALKELGLLEDAMYSYRQALAIKPDFAEAYSNLGVTQRDLCLMEEALANCRRAIELKHDFAEAYSNLGVALRDVGLLDEAVANCQRAIEIRPNYVEAHANLGVALKDLGDLDSAEASYRRALEIKPDYVDAQSNLLFLHNYLSEQSPESMLSEAKHYGNLVARHARPYRNWNIQPNPNQRLRIGLVSGDLYSHPVGYFIEGVLAALRNLNDHPEIYIYATHTRVDVLTDRIKASCQYWCSVVGLSDERLAGQIHKDGIDILIDLSGHTAHNRLPMFSWRPAPIQATWLGYFATTGVAEIDYIIADRWTLPVSEEKFFTEKVWRLPETRLCFTAPDTDIPVTEAPVLTSGYITFGCFNNLTKMNEAVVKVWARVLHAVVGSQLFLKAKQLSEKSVCHEVINLFAAHGIEKDRLILEGGSPRREYLKAYNRVDIALDPFPFTGGTTTVESLWMGVPVLSLESERFVSRQGVGLLMNAGLPDWVAKNADDYVARAKFYAGDLQRLTTLRKGLRKQVLASPVFDAGRFARHFELALRGMWSQWCDTQSKE